MMLLLIAEHIALWDIAHSKVCLYSTHVISCLNIARDPERAAVVWTGELCLCLLTLGVML